MGDGAVTLAHVGQGPDSAGMLESAIMGQEFPELTSISDMGWCECRESNPPTLVPGPAGSIPNNLGTGYDQTLQDIWWAEKLGLDVDQYLQELAVDRANRGIPTCEAEEAP